MENTIALLSTLDTKKEEALYLKAKIEEKGNKVLLVDMASLGPVSDIADINRTSIYKEIDLTESCMVGWPKKEILSALSSGLQALGRRLYKEKAYDAIVAIGGLQNALMAASLMKKLPIGFPKMIVSSVLSGSRQAGIFVGTKDIILVPSVVDFFGINPIVTSVLDNAAAMISCAAKQAGVQLGKKNVCIGLTCMGVTEGLSQIAEILRRKGIQTAAFHATGVGGQAMEELAREGRFKAILDLTVHELVSSEYFRVGPSNGGYIRIEQIGDLGLPAIFAPGGLDFIDLYKEEFFSDEILISGDRKYNMHNDRVVHIKLNEKEAVEVAKIFAFKMNKWVGKKVLILPLGGLRADTGENESLFDVDVDETLLNTIKLHVDHSTRIVEVDANINDEIFSYTVCDEFFKLIEE